MMKKSALLVAILAISSFVSFAADNSAAIIDKVVNTYKALKGISAEYAITTDQGVTNGSIVMQGNKFRMMSNELRCWFNGKLQWSYSTMSEEVNITEPTAEELQMVNPYSIISNFRNNFRTRQLKSATAGNHEVEMIPKNGGDISSVRVTVSRKTYLPMKIVFALKDKTSVIVVMSKYKGGTNYPASFFVFDKNLVPKGTPVVDLR